MIIVDTALRAREAEGKPIRVGILGAGSMAAGTMRRIHQSTPGMVVTCIANRTLERAAEMCLNSTGKRGVEAATAAEVDAAASRGQVALTTDPLALATAEAVDIFLEATGTIEYCLPSILACFEQGKDVVLLNAEIDATIGPILKRRAERAGVLISNCDGDQPGVTMNLYRFVQGIGCVPRVLGNIKGLQDPYRTPETQRAFAEKYKQGVKMVTSFADGTKISFEQAVTANATGFRVARRGMIGLEYEGHIDDLRDRFDLEDLRTNGGIVDYVLGGKPGPGVFIYAEEGSGDPYHHNHMQVYKMGKGPLYSFYTPYHLCYFEVPNTLARVALFRDVTLAPLGGPCVGVISLAKRDLKAGEVLDGIGGFTCYGKAENYATIRAQNLLPMGLSFDCTLKRDIPRDAAITCEDVERPSGRLCDQLRAEQDAAFPVGAVTPA